MGCLRACGEAGPTFRKKVLTGSGEMAQQLRTLATLPEGLGWTLSKHVSPQLSVTPDSRDPKSSSGIHRYQAGLQLVQTDVQAKHQKHGSACKSGWLPVIWFLV